MTFLINPMVGKAGGASVLKPQDVFAATTYAGTNSARNVNTGIDLAGRGGLAWIKNRNGENRNGGGFDNTMFDTARGPTNVLHSNGTNAQYSDTTQLTAFLNNGFALGADGAGFTNRLYNYVAWSFAQAPKFFQCFIYVGNGVARLLPHNLGVQPSMVIIRRIDAVESWPVWHRGFNTGTYAYLNRSNIPTTARAAGTFGNGLTTIDPTATDIYIGATNQVNRVGGVYVCYVFAHDPSGIIQGGYFDVSPSGMGTINVNLGWKPQFIMIRGASVADSWYMLDATRTPGFASITWQLLLANSPNYETPFGSASYPMSVSATGFSLSEGYFASNSRYAYLAIREPY